MQHMQQLQQQQKHYMVALLSTNTQLYSKGMLHIQHGSQLNLQWLLILKLSYNFFFPFSWRGGGRRGRHAHTYMQREIRTFKKGMITKLFWGEWFIDRHVIAKNSLINQQSIYCLPRLISTEDWIKTMNSHLQRLLELCYLSEDTSCRFTSKVYIVNHNAMDWDPWK